MAAVLWPYARREARRRAASQVLLAGVAAVLRSE
jgi:hypothetical protein